MSRQSISEEQPLRADNGKVARLSFFENFKYFASHITVEPAVTLMMVGSVFAMLATQNLNLDKACRVNLNFGNSVCSDLQLRRTANHTFEEREVQKLIASIQGWRGVIQTVPPTLLMLFIGAWSDKTGRRKICILLPTLGEAMTCALNMINTYFFDEVAVEMTVFMEVIFPSLTGGWITLFLGAFSYIGDISSLEMRTFRMGIVMLSMSVGLPLGTSLSGIILQHFGYYGVFGISATLQILNFCYVFFMIPDHTWLANKEKPGVAKGFFKEFFDIHSLKQIFTLSFRRGTNNRRLRIYLILTVVCLSYGTLWGEISINYLFCRYRFNWDEVKFSFFTTFYLVAHSIGTVLSVSVFSKRYSVDDSMLGIISAISKITGSLAMVFANSDYEAYISSLLSLLIGLSGVAARSMASKLVSQQELGLQFFFFTFTVSKATGKVYSLFGLVETIMPVIFIPLYSRVYLTALQALPGAVYLLSVLTSVPQLGIFLWFYKEHKSHVKKRELERQTDPAANEICAPKLVPD